MSHLSDPFLISSALERTPPLMNLCGTSRDEVLHELVCAFPTDRSDLREQLFAAVRAREEFCSTAIDGGIAIPHSRQAIAGLVEQPVLVFARHATGVDFGAPDRSPTRLFFLLCADGVGPHLQMLSRLSRVLRVTGLREQLHSAVASEDIRQVIRGGESRLG
jgi:mannitol/fructose-specific phosphotransferase system IIA component (Ntr-type)